MTYSAEGCGCVTAVCPAYPVRNGLKRRGARPRHEGLDHLNASAIYFNKCLQEYTLFSCVLI
jgi:hypothetical protein